MVINRVFAGPSHETFKIKPIRDLLVCYVGNGQNWIDPYAGDNSPAEFTNDHNPERKAKCHLDALEYAEMFPGRVRGILFDPPYSYRQVSDHYKVVGKKATAQDTSFNFYARVMKPLAARLEKGGIAISFGWNSNGFGKTLGFEIEEILLVAHGMHHNDTIVTVERKVNGKT